MSEIKPLKNVEVYSDGACSGNPGPGGWAAILCFGPHEKVLSGNMPHTTNNRMEVFAVISALARSRSAAMCAYTPIPPMWSTLSSRAGWPIGSAAAGKHRTASLLKIRIYGG